MNTKSSARPILVLAANTPWVYALARALADSSCVTTVRILDLANYRRLRPRWPETATTVHRASIVMPPGYAGTLEPLFRPVMRALIARQQRRLRKLCGLDPLVIVPYPFLAPWVRGISGDRIVYYNLDEYLFYEPERTVRILEQEGELIARAALTLCLSVHQMKTLQGRNPAHAERVRHFPLGVVEDFLNLDPTSAPMASTVGYVGNLSDRVDWKFVSAVAELMPDTKFHFVGHIEAAESSSDWHQVRARTLAMPNVQYEGEVSQSKVREHYWRYAVNWMPYDTRHGFNIASCPTKIMDALASGRPFVATNIPEVRQYPQQIACVNSPTEAATILSRLLRGELEIDATSQVAFASSRTWAHRAAQFRTFFEDYL